MKICMKLIFQKLNALVLFLKLRFVVTIIFYVSGNVANKKVKSFFEREADKRVKNVFQR